MPTQTIDSALATPKSSPVDARALADCMEACVACELACLACADACLDEPNFVALRRCIRLDLDCADICGTTARLLSRRLDANAKMLRWVVEACARACATCGAECHEHAAHHDHCRVCAEACRLCAERCGRVLRDLPDTYGETHPPVSADGVSR
jgi:hypothetical protein